MNQRERIAGMDPSLRAKAEAIDKTLSDITMAARKAWRHALRLRVGNHAVIFRAGIQGAGWSRLWGPLWRYREADERRYLEANASVWGLATLPGEPIAALRKRLSGHVRDYTRAVSANLKAGQ